MNTNELKKYLGIVVDMEKECYIQNRLKNQLMWQLDSLGKTKDIRVPVREYRDIGLEGLVGFPLMGVVAGAVLGFIAYFFLPWGVGDCIKGGALIFGVLGFIFYIWMEYETSMECENKYQKECQEYEKVTKSEQKRISREQKEILFLNHELGILNNQLKQSSEILKVIYDRDVIFPKYRNFVIVSMLYEYLCSGRCVTLEGHEGAYNILENEMRLDRIITGLDYIVSQLEQIKENQFLIYSAISESNQTLSKILDSNQQISNEVRHLKVQGDELNERIACLQNTSEFQLYFTELNQKELSYMRKLGL